MSRYPRLANAAELSRLAIALGKDPSIPERKRSATYDAAHEAEISAFADELSPAIFPDTGWTYSRTWLLALHRQRYGSPGWTRCYDRTLFDHHLVYRRKGLRGPTTWKIAAVVGQPTTPFSTMAP